MSDSTLDAHAPQDRAPVGPSSEEKTGVGFIAPEPGTTREIAAAKREKDTPSASAPPDSELSPAVRATLALLKEPEETGEIGRLGGYRVLRLLGSGGMGAVFHAEDLVLRRAVALKIIQPDLRDLEGGWQRLLREARAMAAIKHEHLVMIYQAGQEGDALFLAMELLEGESLDDRIRRAPPPEPAEILRVGRETAAGLAVIHRHGMIHRDIKPSNIWLEAPGGRVRILDFGLARPVNATGTDFHTQTGAVLGTPAFMSPEQGRGQPLDARSDLFSLGCVLYRMCTGKVPFAGTTLMAQLTSLAVDNPKPAREINPAIPDPLAGLVHHLLEKDPHSRFATAEAVIEEIKRIESGAPSNHFVHSDGVSKRRRRVLALAMFGFAAGGAALFWPRPERADNLRNPSPNSNPASSAAAPREKVSAPAEKPKEAAVPAKAAEADGGKFYLLNMAEINLESVYFPRETGRIGKPERGAPRDIFATMGFNGKASPHGIGMHASPHGPAFISYRLDKKYDKFQAQVTQNESAPHDSESPMTFAVLGDGKLLWESKPVWSPQETQAVSVSVKGVNELRLEVNGEGPLRGAHGLWFEPHLTK